ncbi:hypothetical protein AB7M56_006705 [Bradyrhizobium elkanii]|nr:hypothetical protein [Bradyrhizobium elkanii]MCS3519879.1 hypothetical protein [Bradyrhizobium elkanii]MCS4067534.1 hypothetical protein [Bradyrhizobium elkanii]MCS4083070.1 hypothetical protein [Bradyrhizobium elkanii]MCS4105809.1 hypothetical protein [Bradyrhizobium elkanii]
MDVSARSFAWQSVRSLLSSSQRRQPTKTRHEHVKPPRITALASRRTIAWETQRFHDVLFEFPDSKLRQILGNLCNDMALDVGMQRRPKFGRRARRSDDDKRRRLSTPDDLLRGPRNPLCKPILLEFVPVRRLDGPL